MQYRALGATGLTVSRLCLGTLTLGPLQAKLPLAAGGDLIRAALDLGVNFFDTADLYQTYDYLKEGLRGWPGAVVIASRSYDYTREGMQAALERALRGTGRDCIDVFGLHEQETALTIRGHWPAIEYLLEAKQRGLIKAISISTHAIDAATAMAAIPELDVLFPLINRSGIGILDGTRDGMLAAIAAAKAAGKGIYGMKAIGGGHLLADVPGALRWAADLPALDAIAVGCANADELAMDAAIICGEPVPEAVSKAAARGDKRLRIEDWCQGCGRCVARCRQGALRLSEGRATVDHDRCVLCGYCASVCRDFCIKVY